MLTIALSRLEVRGRHGATAIEPRTLRKFEVDVELVVETVAAEQTDRLVDTVDYSKVAELIVGSGVGEPHHMLESLARRMTDNLRARFPTVRAVRLALRKLNPPSCPGHPAYAQGRISQEDLPGFGPDPRFDAIGADVHDGADGEADVRHGQRHPAAVGEAGRAG